MNTTVEMVCRSFRKHLYHPLRTVSCQLTDGVLILRGNVKTFYLKQLAQETVAKVDGVTIKNEIQVVSP